MYKGVDSDPSAATESVYVVPGNASPEELTRSLQALLPARHLPVLRDRFTVLDTFDGRVRRTGARLTQRRVNGACTVAWQTRAGGHALAARLTQPVGFAWDLPNGPLQQMLTPVIGVRRLLAQVNAEKYGSLLEILDDRRKTVARVRIESGQARLPVSRSAWRTLPTIVTLTGLRGYEDIYARLKPVIESRPGIQYCPDGEHGVMLREVGAPEGGDVSSPRLNLAATIPANVGARQIHLALLEMLRANEPGLRANIDTEFLHDFRVAIRRTRSLLTQISHVFPPEVVKHFSTEFSWIGRLTNPSRDVDVLLLALRERRKEFPADDIDALMTFLGQTQRQHHDGLVQTLDSDRYRRLLSEWETCLRGPILCEGRRGEGDDLLAAAVSKRAWRLSRGIASKGERIDRHTAPTNIHAVRIDAKKLRYLIDLTPAFYEARISSASCVL